MMSEDKDARKQWPLVIYNARNPESSYNDAPTIFVNRKLRAHESHPLVVAWLDFIHLPKNDAWIVAKALIDAARWRSFPFHLATVLLIAELPGVGNDERAYVANKLLFGVSRRKLYRTTIEDIVIFAPDGPERTEAQRRLDEKEFI